MHRAEKTANSGTLSLGLFCTLCFVEIAQCVLDSDCIWLAKWEDAESKTGEVRKDTIVPGISYFHCLRLFGKVGCLVTLRWYEALQLTWYPRSR